MTTRDDYLSVAGELEHRPATWIAAVTIFLASPAIADGAPPYRLCVSSAPKHHEKMTLLEAVGVAKGDYRYGIQIDDGPKLMTDSESGFEYELQSAGPKYLVKIERHGKLVESFWIDFESRDTDALCLWYKPLYETWSVWRLDKSGHLCDCRQQASTKEVP